MEIRARDWRTSLQLMDHLNQRLKLPNREDLTESFDRPVKPIVVTEAGLPTPLKPGLFGIQFPRVEINDNRLSLALVRRFDRPSGKGHGQQSQVPPATEGNDGLSDANRRRRQFPDRL